MVWGKLGVEGEGENIFKRNPWKRFMLGYTAAVILVGLCRMKDSTAVYKGKCGASS